MPQLTQAEIRNNAVSFVHEWKEATRERAEAQTFWNEFLEIFGVKRRRVAVFEKAVKKTGGNFGAIDLFWRGVLLVGHKSRGQNLDKATSQAFEYLESLPETDLPKSVIISDFGDFRLFDLETSEEHAFTLDELPNNIHLFGFISGYTKRTYKDQDPVNIIVAEKMGELHDALIESGVPRVSSEGRRYIPIGFLPKEVVVTDLVSIVPDATLYHFGVLTSAMHMAWMRQVCGRLKSDYRYSNNLVYNNFPFPREPNARQKERVERAAQSVLDARAKYTEATLADLYDPNTMPKELLEAHRKADEAVDAAYGSRRFKTDLERLEFLFDLYRQYTDPLTQLAEKETRRARRRK